MLPSQQFSINNLQTTIQPSLTFKIDFERNRIIGKVDKREAIIQMLQLLLNTERYAYSIYSSQWGTENEKLIGKDYDFITAEIKRTITDAIMVDDRIVSVTDFIINQTGLDSVEISFIVNSIEGPINMSMEVSI